MFQIILAIGCGAYQSSHVKTTTVLALSKLRCIVEKQTSTHYYIDKV